MIQEYIKKNKERLITADNDSNGNIRKIGKTTKTRKQK